MDNPFIVEANGYLLAGRYRGRTQLSPPATSTTLANVARFREAAVLLITNTNKTMMVFR